ncbi:MAG: glycosyltransferase family 61 protein [Pseudomonadota bacterium]
MPWYKSAWRSRLNGRYARWTALRGVAAVAPGLTRAGGFYGRAVGVEQVAGRALHVETQVLETPFRGDQIDFIDRFCTKNDGGVGRYWTPPLRFVDESFAAPEAIVLGHTGQALEREGRALITERGEPADWNHDKLGLLREGAPVEGLAAPIRRFNSYFHFLFEFAVPFTALLESGALRGAPVTLLLSEGSKRFAAETAAALAARYGLSVRALGARERVRAEAVWALRRTRPCPDWYPVSRATADALAEALRRRFGPAAAQGGGPRLYLRRGREKLRNLTNAEALDGLLAARGFEALIPAADNFEAQIARSAAAREIAAVHGAALANLLFARPGTRVVEIFGRGGCKSLYALLCSMLGLEHSAVLGGAADAKQNFAAPLDLVEAALDAPAPGTFSSGF